MRKFSSRQQQVLECLGAGDQPWAFNRRTLTSLERRDLIEHTSTGWRLTTLGVEITARSGEE